jgi:chitin disaccharide deacetylase
MTIKSSDTGPVLIVNADDFGISEGVNRAIVDAHRNGIVTSTSLLATGSAFEHAVQLARELPRLGVGAHLCLHSEVPVLRADRIPSLTTADGKLRGANQAAWNLLTRSTGLAEVKAELAAQMQRIRDAGIAITHMDSHSHLHAFPGMGRILNDLGAQFGVAWVRRAEVWAPAEYFGARLARTGTAAVISCLHALARQHYGNVLRMPDRFLGLARSCDVDEEWMCRTLASLRAGTINELMVHPGDGSPPTGPWGDHDPAARMRDAFTVKSPMVKDRIRTLGIRLASFGELTG